MRDKVIFEIPRLAIKECYSDDHVPPFYVISQDNNSITLCKVDAIILAQELSRIKP
jgi:hypothetical protein